MGETKYEIIKPSEELCEYLKSEKLNYFNLADAYLWIARTIYDVLEGYSSELDKLEKGYKELMEVIREIHQKKTITETDKDRRLEGKETVWNNRNYVKEMMGIYIVSMQNLKQNLIQEKQLKQVKRSICVSLLLGIFAMGLNIWSLLFK